MATSVSLHRIDFSKTEVVKLDNSWVIRFYDDERNNISLFVDRAQDIYELSKQLVSLTVKELANPINTVTIDV
jgi:hypothetical protein